MRKGSDYVTALRDGRTVYVDGERVPDVTTYPAFVEPIRRIAATYELAREEVNLPVSSYVDPVDGRRHAAHWLIPRAPEDLTARRKAHRGIGHGLGRGGEEADMGSDFKAPAIRKYVTIVEDVRSVAGITAERPLRRAAVAAVLSNPYAGRYIADLKPLIDWSAALGDELGKLAVQALGAPAESYGKAGIAGVNGEQEHANALLTTTMAEGMRKAVGGGKAWISSASKVGPPGTAIDVPLAHKDALYVRSHYDAIEVRVPDAPLPNELVIIVAVASGARLNARVGGLRAEDIQGQDGLR